MDTKTDPGGETQQFSWPNVSEICIELAYLESDDQRVRDVASRIFSSANPKISYAKETDVLAKAAKVNEVQQQRLARERRSTDFLDRFISGEQLGKPHWATRVAGLATGLLGVGLMLPVPLIVAAGIEESLLIERVIEQPLWALGYGLAPFAAVLATHGIRDTVKTDRGQRRFDATVFTGTIAVFTAWSWNYGPTFLVDTLSNPTAALEQASSLSRFYAIHLPLEIFGAASAYCGAMHLLTSGAKWFVRPSEGTRALSTLQSEHTDADLVLAQKRDQIGAEPARYDAALTAFQEHCLIKVAVARKLFEAKSASESLNTLASLRSKILSTLNGDNDA